MTTTKTCTATVTEFSTDPSPATEDDRERKSVLKIRTDDCMDATVSFTLEVVFDDKVQNKKRKQAVAGATNLPVKNNEVEYTVVLYPEKNEVVEKITGENIQCTCYDA